VTYTRSMTKYEGTKLANFEPIQAVEKLEIIDIEPGAGEVVNPGATITAHYTGALCKNGIIFQSSHDFGQAITFGLDQVIKGWTDGVPGMKVGGMRRLIIPSEQAYGSARAASNIPPNSDLVFDIELVAIPQNG
jgi:FKBP-type peptidyl-prolyl cis-trans isomerase